MKKIFTVSTVKNENDIIESFCRYNITYCDGMLIKDNGSSDNTKEIIQSLINEGLPIFWTQKNDQTERAHEAIDEYGADLIIPLDADEFLYHVDGINPREELEALNDKVEYQALWRTFVYEDEPNISLGFMPNNFKEYRNPEMESSKRYIRHKKVLASKYHFKQKQAVFVTGSHFLEYPDKDIKAPEIVLLNKIVFSHFPVRSHKQVMKKTIPNWTYKWGLTNRSSRGTIDYFQWGVLYKILKEKGEISKEELQRYSLEYAMFLDANVVGNIKKINRSEMDSFLNELGSEIKIFGPMNVSFCLDRLALRYTNYIEDNKAFIRAVTNQIDKTVTFLDMESADKTQHIYELTKSMTKTGILFYDTGSGFNEDEKHVFQFTGNEVDISFKIPQNAIAMRLDPVEEYGCIVSGLEVLSCNGIVIPEPTNGFFDGAGNYFFSNPDPQFTLPGVAYWLKIKYQIIPISSFSQYKTLKTVIQMYQERNHLEVERNRLEIERNHLIIKQNNLESELNHITADRDTLTHQINEIYNSKTWKTGEKIKKFIRFFIPRKGFARVCRF